MTESMLKRKKETVDILYYYANLLVRACLNEKIEYVHIKSFLGGRIPSSDPILGLNDHTIIKCDVIRQSRLRIEPF